MDTCPICKATFPRKYRSAGKRQVYCSKACRYKGWFFDRTCPTCGKVFRTNKLSTRKDYCSVSCMQREPCQLCGEPITGRKTYQGGARRFCSHRCANVVNRTLASKKSYTTRGFAATIKRIGALACERCSYDQERALVVHHKNRNRQDNKESNLVTLCANCHMLEHSTRKDGATRARALLTARFIARHC